MDTSAGSKPPLPYIRYKVNLCLQINKKETSVHWLYEVVNHAAIMATTIINHERYQNDDPPTYTPEEEKLIDRLDRIMMILCEQP